MSARCPHDRCSEGALFGKKQDLVPSGKIAKFYYFIIPQRVMYSRKEKMLRVRKVRWCESGIYGGDGNGRYRPTRVLHETTWQFPVLSVLP